MVDFLFFLHFVFLSTLYIYLSTFKSKQEVNFALKC
jgi:hypothetical protein